MSRLLFLFWLLGVGVAFATGFFERPSLLAYDYFEKQTAPKSTSKVALILFDQSTVENLAKADQLYFPFPREILGAAAQVASAAGAKGIVYDLLFTEPSSHGVDDDLNFAQLIRDAKIPIFSPDGVANGELQEPIKNIKTALKNVGSSALDLDVDGTTRKFPREARVGNKISLPIDQRLALNFDSSPKQPTDQDRIRFYSKEAVPTISFYNLLIAYRKYLDSGKWDEASKEFGELRNLKDRIWFIGYSAPGLYDLKPTPLDPRAAGVEILAAATENRLNRNYIETVPSRLVLCFVAIYLLLIVLCLSRSQTPKSAALFLGFAAGIFPFILAWALWGFGFWLDPMPFLFGGMATGILQTCTAFQKHWKERLKLAKSLEFSMSPEMVELIRTGRVDISRYGEKREVTILFCDLAGFSGLSEILEPEELVKILNEYLDLGASLIIENKGYVDKFIGDAIMAFWNAPIDQPDHAMRALESAIVFSERVAERMKNLSVRIGLHTGEALVGNIGARSRHNYTAIGDSVNLASRLEGLCKAYGLPLLVSEATIRATLGENYNWKKWIAYEVDHVIVKGRSRPLKVFAFGNPTQAELIGSYGRGLQAYYRGEFADGLRYFEMCEGLPPAVEMQARCHNAIVHGAAAKFWQEGVWKHEAK